MATTTGLVRSFYGWLARTREALAANGLHERKASLPSQFPTALPAVTVLARQVASVLQNTAFSDKAQKWVSLFENIQVDGWKGEVRSVDLDRIRIRRELKEAAQDGLSV